MPVDMKRYPANWKAVSQRIRERDGHCCKFCGVPDRAVGYRLPDGQFIEIETHTADDFEADGHKVIRIVLTVAHLSDPDPHNCADENLAALCQRCHNRLDAPMRRRNASATMAAKKAAGMLQLF